MIIHLHYDTGRAQYLEVLLRLKNRAAADGFRLVDMRDRGIDTSWPDGKPDAIIAHPQWLTPDVLHTGIPVILAERLDCSVLWARQQASHDSVKVVWKIAAGKQGVQNIGAKRYHTMLLGDNDRLPEARLREGVYEKIQVVPGYLHYPMMARWWHQLYQEWTGPRNVVASFFGKVQYGNDWVVSHRASCIEAIGRSHVVTEATSKRIPRGAYDDSLRRSISCVSPWGYGELCWRDFEAAAAGCVLVKPYTDWVDCWPQIFEAGVTYVTVCRNWCDLNDRLLDIKKDPAKYAPIVQEARARCRETLSDEAIYGRFSPGLEALRSI